MDEPTNPDQHLTDQTAPEGAWVFDAEVAKCFDNMLERSIPQYRVMREAVTTMACAFHKRASWIVDIGCSRGEQIRLICDALGQNAKVRGIEIAEPMVQEAEHNLRDWIANEIVQVEQADARTDFPPVPASVHLSVLCLQFIPIEDRQGVVQDSFKYLEPGGALIVVEKILGGTKQLDDLMVDRYYRMKKENGYSQEDIDRKRLSLSGVLVPLTEKWLVDMLHHAGFQTVECFWRWMNFGGWVAVKPT